MGYELLRINTVLYFPNQAMSEIPWWHVWYVNPSWFCIYIDCSYVLFSEATPWLNGDNKAIQKN